MLQQFYTEIMNYVFIQPFHLKQDVTQGQFLNGV